ncbi:MAG: hypothetical protein ACD_54C01236G0001, partial [uncultured bacterium]
MQLGQGGCEQGGERHLQFHILHPRIGQRQPLFHRLHIRFCQRCIKALERIRPVPDPARGSRGAVGIKPKQQVRCDRSNPRQPFCHLDLRFPASMIGKFGMGKGRGKGGGGQRLAQGIVNPPDQRRDGLGRGWHIFAVELLGIKKTRQQQVFVFGHVAQHLRGAQSQRGGVPVPGARKAKHPRGQRRCQIGRGFQHLARTVFFAGQQRHIEIAPEQIGRGIRACHINQGLRLIQRPDGQQFVDPRDQQSTA